MYKIKFSGIYDRMLYFFTFDKPPEDKKYFLKRWNQCEKIVPKLREHLKPLLSEKMSKIAKALGVSWRAKPVRIYVLLSTHKQMRFFGFSDPLTVVLQFWKDGELVPMPFERLTRIILHELCHVIQESLHDTGYYPFLKKRNELQHRLVRNHYLTYALMKTTCPVEYEQEKKIVVHPQYMKAIELVEQDGAEHIIAEAKTFLEKP
jgi:hypothetical protein